MATEYNQLNGSSGAGLTGQARLEWLKSDLNQGQKDTVLHLQNMIHSGTITQDAAQAKLAEVQKASPRFAGHSVACVLQYTWNGR